MNKTLKIVVATVFGILLLIIIIQGFQNRSLKKTNQIQSVELMTIKDSAQAFKTKNDEAYFKINALTVDANALKTSLIESGFAIKDLKQRDINNGKIIAALKAEIESSGHVDSIPLVDVIIPVDSGKPSIKAKKFDWTNHYLTLTGLIKETNMSLDYKYKTDLSLISEKKGKSIIVTAWLSDPNAIITTGHQITISNKTKWYNKPWLWGLAGLTGGYFLTK